jgi:hypothetical protein
MRHPIDLHTVIENILRRELARLGEGGPLIPPSKNLRAACTAIEKEYGAGDAVLASKSRFDLAVRKLLASNPRLDARDRFAIAYRLAEATPLLGDRCLLVREDLWPRLIGDWRSEAETGRLRIGHWKGLFHSYLQAEAGPAAEQLREFLRSTWSLIRARVKAEDIRVAGINRHIALLNEDPCRNYARELVAEGCDSMLRDLQATVAVPSVSWFWSDLQNAVCEGVTRLSDEDFKRSIPNVIRAARSLPLNTNAVLAALVDRYADCTDRRRHEELLEFALEKWRSPQLNRNVLWRNARSAGKQMVCGWLALEDLEDFYRLCQGAGTVDERRLLYWLRFKEQITFSQILLGADLHQSKRADLRSFRERKRGRLGVLSKGGGGNNAIIMQIADWIFVEFSATSNACYPYQVDHLPFKIGEMSYSLHQLKSQAHVDSAGAERLTHAREWETDSFDPFLQARGIFPDSQAVPRDRLGMPREPNGMRPLTPEMIRQLHAIGASIRDLRPKGGALWVCPDGLPVSLQKSLKALGFKWKSDKGFYLC